MTLIKMGTSLVALSQLCSILSIPKRGVFCHAMSGRNFHKILFKSPVLRKIDCILCNISYIMLTFILQMKEIEVVQQYRGFLCCPVSIELFASKLFPWNQLEHATLCHL